MNWLGSSTASHSTLRMPAASPSSTVVSMCCRPCPNSWKSVCTSSKVISDGRVADRRRLVADEVGDRQRARARRAADALVHPRAAALLGRSAVGIEVEGGAAACRPRRRTRKKRTSGCQTGASPSAARTRTPKSRSASAKRPSSTRGSGKYGPQLLVAVVEALLAQPLGPERDVPVARGRPPRERRPRGRARAARRGRARAASHEAARSSSSSCSTAAHVRRHLAGEAHLGVAREAEQLRPALAAVAGCARSAACCRARHRSRG